MIASRFARAVEAPTRATAATASVHSPSSRNIRIDRACAPDCGPCSTSSRGSGREQVQTRVAEHLGADTIALIGHSLGSVVAYEAAHRHTHPLPVLITLGSPLGMRNVVYERTRPQPPAVPPLVRRWVNVADRDDLVAASLDLTTRFPGPDGILESTYTVDNGAKPHEASFYLAKKSVANAVANVLRGG